MIAKNTPELPLSLFQLSSSTLLHRGVSRQQDGFKDTMCALEAKATKVGIISQHPYLFRASKDQGIAPYLQLSLLTDLNHTWWLKPYPAIQALLFRLKFDAVKGTPSSTGHSGDQPPRCLWCQSNIKHAEIKRSAADPAAQLQDDQHETKATTKMCNYIQYVQYTHCNLQRVLS